MDRTTVTNVLENIGTAYGHRGIMFIFDVGQEKPVTVTIDFYGNGRNLNGKRYCDAEAAALMALAAKDLKFMSFRHRLFS